MKITLTLDQMLEAINKRGKPKKTLPPIPKAGGVFRPMVCRTPMPPSRDVVSMECNPTGYGLVVHVACGRRGGEGFFDISDPETGARLVAGGGPGRDAALDGLAECVRAYYADHPRGNYRRALQASREIFNARLNFCKQKRGTPS